MNKIILIVSVGIIFFSSAMTYAAEVAKNEEQCQNAVTAKLEALEAASEKEGKEVKLKDLSALDIMNIAKSKGACVANEEIKRREK